MDAAYDRTRKAFAAALKSALVSKGWTQSELTRRANAQLDPTSNQTIGKALVNRYVHGKCMPTTEYLLAIAKALDVEPADLVKGPRGIRAQLAKEHVSVSEHSDGHA